jgi:hypothetical protein
MRQIHLSTVLHILGILWGSGMHSDVATRHQCESSLALSVNFNMIQGSTSCTWPTIRHILENPGPLNQCLTVHSGAAVSNQCKSGYGHATSLEDMSVYRLTIIDFQRHNSRIDATHATLIWIMPQQQDIEAEDSIFLSRVDKYICALITHF